MNFQQFAEQYDEYTKNIPPILYHATWNPLIPNISRLGLGGNIELRNFDGIETGVYLAENVQEAISFVEATENEDIPEDWYEQIVVCEVDTTKLDLSKLYKDPNIIMLDGGDYEYRCFVYKAVIPLTAIADIKEAEDY